MPVQGLGPSYISPRSVGPLVRPLPYSAGCDGREARKAVRPHVIR